MLVLKIILLFVAGLLDIVFSLLVLARDRKRLNNLSFFALAFSMGGWALGIAAFMIANESGAAFKWAKVYYFFPLVISASLIIFAATFPNRNMSKKGLMLVVAGFLGLALPLLTQRAFVTEQLIYHEWGKEIVLDGAEYVLYSAYLLLLFPLALGIMFKKSKTLTGLYGVQALFFFIGFSIAAIFGVLFNLALPAIGNYRLIWVGPLFTTFFTVSIGYSIVRHKMFDIRLVLARSLSYAVSLTIVSALYGFIIFGLAQLLLGVHFALVTEIFLAVGTGLSGLTFSRFRKLFDKATNKLFYQDAYEPQELYDNLNKILASSIDLDKLLRHSTKLLASSIKAEYCAIGLKDVVNDGFRLVSTSGKVFSAQDIAFARRYTTHFHQTVIATDYLEDTHEDLKNILKANGIAMLVRLSPNVRNAEEGLGYLILGNKKSGNPYTVQDFRVLDTIAKELIIAIQNALRFEEIQNFNLTLQAKVDEATRKMRRTNDKLKALDETKDDFISMASHQLRTPLTSVKGYLSMVLEGDAGKLTATQKQMLGQAYTSSQRMVYLIADLLNVSRLKTGKFIIETSPVNLAQIVSEELLQLTEAAKSRNLSLEFTPPEHFPEVMLDETKIRQVIMNFADNAIYYTPDGGHIRIELSDKPQSVELRVIDNGLGVPKAEQPHLFTKFFRAANARKARPDGTGLGLFMAKKVIIAQGGALLFNSVEGKGSTFGFSFGKQRLAAVPEVPVVDAKS